MSDCNANESCSAGGRLIAYLVVTGATLASMALLLFRALPTLLRNCG